MIVIGLGLFPDFSEWVWGTSESLVERFSPAFLSGDLPFPANALLNFSMATGQGLVWGLAILVGVEVLMLISFGIFGLDRAGDFWTKLFSLRLVKSQLIYRVFVRMLIVGAVLAVQLIVLGVPVFAICAAFPPGSNELYQNAAGALIGLVLLLNAFDNGLSVSFWQDLLSAEIEKA
jgi:hypothetical protein